MAVTTPKRSCGRGRRLRRPSVVCGFPLLNLCGYDLHVGACRRDHQLKQHPRWKLEQTRPGYFTWTTPGGRTYTVGPDTHPV